jgi:RNA polymerase sigma-70 factor (ECF subfamily)
MAHTAEITWTELHRELYGFVYPRVKDKVVAEDIVQDVFIRAHTKSAQLRDVKKIVGWIYQIARNAITDHYRQQSREIKPVNVDWESNNHEYNECVGECLKIMMATLPDKYRKALELIEIDGLSQHDLAERLDISYSGARSRVQRARKMLREKMDELFLIKTDKYGNVIICEDRIPPKCCAC